MRKSKRKLLAMLLAGTMVFGMLPSNAFANNEQETTSTVVDETVTTDDSAKLEEEGETNQGATEVEAPVEEALPEGDANTEVAVDLSLEEIKLQKTEEINAGEKYIIVYDNKKALATGKDSIIAEPIEIEGDTVKTEITKNIVWTVDENGSIKTEDNKYLLNDVTLNDNAGTTLKFEAKSVLVEETNTYLTYSEETKEWSFTEVSNEDVTYYNVIGDTSNLEKPVEEPAEPELGTEGEDTVEDSNEDETAADLEEDIPETLAVGDVTYVLDTDGVDSGEEYLIVASSTNRALRNNNGNIDKSDNITIPTDGKITNKRNASLWTFNKNTDGTYTIKNGSYYLDLSAEYIKVNSQWSWRNYKALLKGESNNLSISVNNGVYKIERNITSDDNNTTSYLYYTNNNFSATGDTSTVRLYKKVVEQEKTIDAVYFPVTMYDYDAGTFNGDSELRFTNNAAGEKLYINKWIGMSGGINYDKRIVQGIAKDKFDDVYKNIDFNFTENGIFTTTPSTGKSVYTNVQFPFIKGNDGYYTFDSSKNHVHFNGQSGSTISLYDGAQSVNGVGTFFPFNNEGDTQTNVHFGMNMGVNFLMPTDGKNNGEDIIFEFSGDDDVWVFIDGNLALDLGGIHGSVEGKINLTNGEITYNAPGGIFDTTGNSKTPKYNLYSDGILSETDFKNGDSHTLQVYYLERGANVSNCKIRFNLQQQEVLEISKELGASTPITNSEFTLRIEKQNITTNVWEPYSPGTGYLYNGNTLINPNHPISSDGKVKLERNQTIRFYNPEDGNYRVIEEDATGYKTTWITKKNGSELSNTKIDTKNSPEIEVVRNQDDGKIIVNTYSINCTNSADVTLRPDTIVLDYGKPVKFNITNNDNIENITGASLVGIAKSSNLTSDDKLKTELSTKFNTDKSSVILDNGNIKLIEVDSNKNEVEYTPTKFMESIDKATYAVKYEVGDVAEKEEDKTYNYQYEEIKVIPATSVYYEDNFGVEFNEDGTVKSSTGIVFNGSWSNEGITNIDKIYQDSAQDGNYGYDSSYTGDNNFSNGSAMMITSDNNDGTNTAEFEFNGTGFDLISRTDNNTGSIIVEVSGDNLEKPFKTIVNNKYTTENGILYQIPVISFRAEELVKEGRSSFGEYTVKITVGKTNFYLDAIRLYNPLGFENDEANEQYKADKEYGANIREVRNLLISSGSFNKDNISGVNGIVYVDTKSNVGDIATYKNIGPNNEVYLENGNAIAFKIDGYENADSIQIGVKVPNTNTNDDNVVVNGTQNITVKTATDMYYDITNIVKTSNGVVTISNAGQNIISITNIKITSGSTSTTFEIVSDLETIVMANMLAYEASTNKSADIDGSGVVDIYDLASVASNQNKEVIIGVSTDIYRQDLTGTRTINREDLNIVKDNIQ